MDAIASEGEELAAAGIRKVPHMMAHVVPPPNDKKRVKVYELKNNDWFDRGTGFCTGRSANVSTIWSAAAAESSFLEWPVVENYGLQMADLGLDRMNRKSTSSLKNNPSGYCWKRRLRKMMDTRNNKVILSKSLPFFIATDDTSDTLIVWTESNGTDMALSFQEAEGCAAIW